MRRRWLTLALLLVVGAGWRTAAARPPAVIVVEGAWYRAYFTQPVANAPVPRAGGVDAALAADLVRAKRSIRIATFDFDLRSLTDPLLAAQRRGVAVQLVVDAENLSDPLAALQLGALQRAGVAVTFDRRSAFMHNKFVVIDDAVVWTGSWNMTLNDTFRNNNNMLRIVHRELAANYTAKFAVLWAGRGGVSAKVALPHADLRIAGRHVVNVFSPDAPITDLVVARIAAARTSIDVLAFTMTAAPIAGALTAAQARGVPVRAVLERRNALAASSSIDDLRAGKVAAQIDGNCAIMHHKVIIVDQRTVITGSFNWTNAAQTQNDENVLIVDDPQLAAAYTAEFERMYRQALQPQRC